MPRGTYGNGPLDSYTDFSTYERCITRGIAGSTLRVVYGNGQRIVQAPGVVALATDRKCAIYEGAFGVRARGSAVSALESGGHQPLATENLGVLVL